MLEGVVGGEIRVGAAGGEGFVDDAVSERRGRLCGDVAGADVDDDGANGFGAEVEAEGILWQGASADRLIGNVSVGAKDFTVF
jgi:hypothetical protein